MTRDPVRSPAVRSGRPKPVYHSVTELDRRALMALGQVRFPPATASKRFAREQQLAKELTEKQRKFLWRIVYHFRRQIHDEEVLAEMRRLRAWSEDAPWRTVRTAPEAPAAPVRHEPTPEEDAALPSLFDDWEARS